MISQSGARLAGRVEHLAADLHAPVGVRVRPVLLQERGRRQHHVGELGRLGEEDVLHDEELERRERLADLVDVRVREERVLAHHVHAAHAALERAADDLGDGQAGLGVERRGPTRPRTSRARTRCRRAGSRGTSSGSGPRRRRPARCSGRAAGAGRCPGLPTWPVIAHIAIRQRELSVPVVCWEIPMPQKMTPAPASPQSRATSRIVAASMPQICAARSGGYCLTSLASSP